MFARKDALGRHEKMDAQGKKTYCSAKALEDGMGSSYMSKASASDSSSVNSMRKLNATDAVDFNSQNQVFQQNLQEHLRILGTYNGM